MDERKWIQIHAADTDRVDALTKALEDAEAALEVIEKMHRRLTPTDHETQLEWRLSLHSGDPDEYYKVWEKSENARHVIANALGKNAKQMISGEWCPPMTAEDFKGME